MRSLAILADDLTGALDAAAPFATSSEPVRVSWRDAPLSGEPRIAFDTESRDLAGDQAATRVASALTRFGDAGLRFKKLDSLIRGNTLLETATCTASPAFRSVVIAPAFPEENRITRHGTQIAPDRNGRATPVADLAAGLRQHGVPLALVQRGGKLPRRGISLCDAETSNDLAAIAHQGANLDGPVLWCGSAGLARALGPSASDGRSIRLGAGPRLFIVGSPHPVALSQAARLRTLLGAAMVAVTGDLRPTDTVTPAVRAIAVGQSGAITFDIPTLDAMRVEAIMSATFSALARSPPPPVVVVVGGDTLFRLCRATAATSLLAIGEWAPGVPIARIDGGAWDGTSIVTKSGAFADRDVLVRLLEGPPKEECTWT